MPSLTIGSQGDAVRTLQQALISKGFEIEKADGKFGAKTADALKKFQEANGLEVDGKAGKQTLAKLGVKDDFDTGAVTQTQRVEGDAFADSSRAVATLSRFPSGPGMVSGTLVLNGNSYKFNTGTGSNLSVPLGNFEVTKHQTHRSLKDPRQAPFVRNGVGFSFALGHEGMGEGRAKDARATVKLHRKFREHPGERSLLRIHPDGRSPGSEGCIALTGTKAELERFRRDMLAAIDANGGSFKLTVRVAN